jgi:integrase
MGLIGHGQVKADSRFSHRFGDARRGLVGGEDHAGSLLLQKPFDVFRVGGDRQATNGEGLRSATFYGRFRRYLAKAGLPPAGLHILRHSAAKLRRDAGESIEDVSRFLDHSSLAVTTVYLRRLEGQEDRGWGKVAEAIGLVGLL